MTKILHVTECYDGGVSRAIETISQLAPAHEHHVYKSGDASPAENIKYETFTEMPRNPIKAILGIRKIVAQLQPDVIHAHSSWAGFYVRISKFRVPVVYEPHCYKFDSASRSKLLAGVFRGVEKLLSYRTDTTVVLSAFESEQAEKLNRSMHRHYLPNVATYSPPEPADATGFATGNTIAMIGRVSPQKDPDFFREVARLVWEKLPSAKFRWIGGGDSVEERLMQQQGIEVTGWLDEVGMRNQLGTPFVYFHSAAWEGLPLSVLDAAAYEHPIILRLFTNEGVGGV